MITPAAPLLISVRTLPPRASNKELIPFIEIGSPTAVTPGSKGVNSLRLNMPDEKISEISCFEKNEATFWNKVPKISRTATSPTICQIGCSSLDFVFSLSSSIKNKTRILSKTEGKNTATSNLASSTLPYFLKFLADLEERPLFRMRRHKLNAQRQTFTAHG